jgi:hypothetical protein
MLEQRATTALYVAQILVQISFNNIKHYIISKCECYLFFKVIFTMYSDGNEERMHVILLFPLQIEHPNIL